MGASRSNHTRAAASGDPITRAAAAAEPPVPGRPGVVGTPGARLPPLPRPTGRGPRLPAHA